MTIGVIGLGFMGTAISANIVKEGFAVWGYDVLKERTDILVENGGQAASSCREVAQKSDPPGLPHQRGRARRPERSGGIWQRASGFI